MKTMTMISTNHLANANANTYDRAAPLPSIERVTAAIGDINPLGGHNAKDGPKPIMELSAKGLRRRLARQPAMSPVIGHKRASRRVPTTVVTEVLKKRAAATRAAAVQSWVDTGALPKPASRRKVPASERTPANAPEAGVSSERAVESTSGALAG